MERSEIEKIRPPHDESILQCFSEGEDVDGAFEIGTIAAGMWDQFAMVDEEEIVRLGHYVIFMHDIEAANLTISEVGEPSELQQLKNSEKNLETALKMRDEDVATAEAELDDYKNSSKHDMDEIEHLQRELEKMAAKLLRSNEVRESSEEVTILHMKANDKLKAEIERVKGERDELAHKLSVILCKCTNNQMSKPGYSLEVMEQEIEDDYMRVVAEETEELTTERDRLREATELKRNVVLPAKVTDRPILQGAWVAIPEEDFDKLRAALNPGEGDTKDYDPDRFNVHPGEDGEGG